MSWLDHRQHATAILRKVALAYYYEHRAEFEAEILRQAERAKAWAEAAKDSPIRQRPKEQGMLP